MPRESGLKSQLESYLKEHHSGIENAVKLKHLPFGKSGQRDVRRAIHRLRLQGVPIGSYNDGYFYAETKEEIDVCIMYIKSMATNIAEAITGLEKSKESLEV